MPSSTRPDPFEPLAFGQVWSYKRSNPFMLLARGKGDFWIGVGLWLNEVDSGVAYQYFGIEGVDDRRLPGYERLR